MVNFLGFETTRVLVLHLATLCSPSWYIGLSVSPRPRNCDTTRQEHYISLIIHVLFNVLYILSLVWWRSLHLFFLGALPVHVPSPNFVVKKCIKYHDGFFFSFFGIVPGFSCAFGFRVETNGSIDSGLMAMLLRGSRTVVNLFFRFLKKKNEEMD